MAQKEESEKSEAKKIYSEDKNFVAYSDRNAKINVFRLNETRSAVYDSLLKRCPFRLKAKVSSHLSPQEDGKLNFDMAFGEVEFLKPTKALLKASNDSQVLIDQSLRDRFEKYSDMQDCKKYSSNISSSNSHRRRTSSSEDSIQILD